VSPEELWINAIFVQDNAVQLTLTASAENGVNLPIFVRQAAPPVLEPGGFDFVRTNQVTIPPDGGSLSPLGESWYYGVGNVSTGVVTFVARTDMVVTNDNGNYFQVLSNLNNQLGPYYRYESGSSMAAAGVSGTLALMQEFFEQT
jgi:hypothetical protein